MRPFITIEQRAQEALDFYSAIFPSFHLHSTQHHPEPNDALIMLATFSIRGQELMISDSPIEHEWGITPGVSFFLDVDNEINLLSLAEQLSDEGKVMMPPGNYGFSKQFAWVEDRFGINWQLNVE